MSAMPLPDSVVSALGQDASRDLKDWIEKRLEDAALDLPPISALVARQKVNVLLLERVSNLLLAAEPELEQLPEGKWVWRVPADLTFPGHGRVGRVGDLEVDAYTGEVRYSDDLLAQIAENARQLAQTRKPTSRFVSLPLVP